MLSIAIGDLLGVRLIFPGLIALAGAMMLAIAITRDMKRIGILLAPIYLTMGSIGFETEIVSSIALGIMSVFLCLEGSPIISTVAQTGSWAISIPGKGVKAATDLAGQTTKGIMKAEFKERTGLDWRGLKESTAALYKQSNAQNETELKNRAIARASTAATMRAPDLNEMFMRQGATERRGIEKGFARRLNAIKQAGAKARMETTGAYNNMPLQSHAKAILNLEQAAADWAKKRESQANKAYTEARAMNKRAGRQIRGFWDAKGRFIKVR